VAFIILFSIYEFKPLQYVVQRVVEATENETAFTTKTTRQPIPTGKVKKIKL